MISCIVTGHGEFSNGLTHALEMIAGPQENVIALPFREEEPLETYQKNLEQLSKEMLNKSDELVIFTDLMGGTPFNQSMLVKLTNNNVHVLAGTNLPILLEFMAQTMMGTEIEDLLIKVIESAKQGIVIGELPTEKAEEETDGI